MPLKFYTFLFIAFVAIQVKADSPLTSTTFYQHYLEYKAVEQASFNSMPDASTLEFLVNNENRLDVKLAVINALGIMPVSARAPMLLQALTEKYQSGDLTSYTPEDLTCYAYLMALDDYFSVTEAASWIDLALQKNQQSAAIIMIWTLIQAQQLMDYNWCSVWQITSTALKAMPESRDIKTAAIQTMIDYLILYKEYCE